MTTQTTELTDAQYLIEMINCHPIPICKDEEKHLARLEKIAKRLAVSDRETGLSQTTPEQDAGCAVSKTEPFDLAGTSSGSNPVAPFNSQTTLIKEKDHE